MSVSAWIARTARVAPNRTAIVWNGRRIAYRELDARANRAAHALTGLGARPGNRVALAMRNRPEFIEAYLGVLRAGLVAVPLNPLLHPVELAGLVEYAEPAVLLHDAATEEHAAAALQRLPGLRAIRLPDQYEAILARAADTAPAVEHPPSSTAAIAYTSGTTGKPKGVMLSAANLEASVVNGITAFGLTGSTRNVLFQPLSFHPLLVGHVLGPLCVGGQITLLGQFDPEEYLDTVMSERATFLVHVPTTIRRTMAEQERRRRDLSSVRTLFTGGAPLTASAMEQALAHVPRLIQGYGLTEATNILTCTAEDRPSGLADCGHILPRAELKIMEGEICVRGEVVMQGYWRNPQATTTALQDSWLRTGDLGEISELGTLRITGRIKDVINSAGVKIHAAEVEEAITRHTAVAEAAVVGVPDADWGEIIHAWVVPAPGAVLTSEEILAHCGRLLARFKHPRQISLIDSLPKNANGKVQKELLRARRTGV